MLRNRICSNTANPIYISYKMSAIYYSDNLVNFKKVETGGNISGIVYSNGIFFCRNYKGAFWSKDGAHWFNIPDLPSGFYDGLIYVSYVKGKYYLTNPSKSRQFFVIEDDFSSIRKIEYELPTDTIIGVAPHDSIQMSVFGGYCGHYQFNSQTIVNRNFIIKEDFRVAKHIIIGESIYMLSMNRFYRIACDKNYGSFYEVDSFIFNNTYFKSITNVYYDKKTNYVYVTGGKNFNEVAIFRFHKDNLGDNKECGSVISNKYLAVTRYKTKLLALTGLGAFEINQATGLIKSELFLESEFFVNIGQFVSNQ